MGCNKTWNPPLACMHFQENAGRLSVQLYMREVKNVTQKLQGISKSIWNTSLGVERYLKNSWGSVELISPARQKTYTGGDVLVRIYFSFLYSVRSIKGRICSFQAIKSNFWTWDFKLPVKNWYSTFYKCSIFPSFNDKHWTGNHVTWT